jgi:hypothetical protein
MLVCVTGFHDNLLFDDSAWDQSGLIYTNKISKDNNKKTSDLNLQQIFYGVLLYLHCLRTEVNNDENVLIHLLLTLTIILIKC